MIKYADRGLVERDGKTRPLFDQLYYLLTSSFSCVGLGKKLASQNLKLIISLIYIYVTFVVIDFGKYLKKGLDAEEEMKYFKLCIKNFDHQTQENHNLLVSMAFLILILVVALVLFLGVRYYIQMKARRLLQKNYQRNLVTLAQNFQFFFSFITLEISLAILLNILEQQAQNG